MTRDNWFFLGAAVAIWLGIAAAILHGQPPAPPGQPQAATATITVLVNGKPIATGAVLNINSGAGVIASATPDPAINGTDITFDADMAVMLSKTAAQSAPLTLSATSAQNPGVTYIANLNPAVLAYTPGAPFVMIPDVPTQPGATIDVGGVGPVAILGTCARICWLLYAPPTNSNPTAAMVVH